MTALAIFGVSSAACAYAATSGELIAARAVLGLGAAAIMPLALAIIPVLFAPEERQKATAVMASTIFLSFPIGPLVGGVLRGSPPRGSR
jgi:MFS family permease